MPFSHVSTYYLILELLNNGDCGLLPDIEPISLSSIVDELLSRSKENFGSDPEAWARWFAGNKDHGTDIERANTLIFLKTREMFSEFSKNNPK